MVAIKGANAGRGAPPLKDAETKKPRRHHREWSGATLILLAGLAGLIGGRLGVLWLRFDTLSQFTAQAIMVAIGGMLGLFMPRYKGLLAVVFLALLLAAYGIYPQMSRSLPISNVPAGSFVLKVATFNIDGDASHPEDIAASIRAMDADVIGLSEVEAADLPMLEGLKDRWPAQLYCMRENECSVAILSKSPLEERADPLSSDSWFIKAKLDAAHGNLTIVTAHLTRYPFVEAQAAQLQGMAKSLDNAVGPIVVMGDFNATPFSHMLRDFADRLNLQTGSQLPSWPATYGFPQLAIDNILAGQGINFLSKPNLGMAAGSDHYPLFMTLTVPSAH